MTTSHRTLSLALPSSLLTTLPTLDLRTLLTGTLARAATTFRTTEIVIYNDLPAPPPCTSFTTTPPPASPQATLLHLLSYIETPPYLRKHLFPLHANLKSAGLLPALEIPSHLRVEQATGVYREGVAVRAGKGETVVDCGFGEGGEVVIAGEIPKGCRVTVRLLGEGRGEAVGPEEPGKEGVYWGYSVRGCEGLSQVFTECRWEGGYDVSIGCMRGAVVKAGGLVEAVRGKAPGGGHVLIAFGGQGGLREALGRDEVLKGVAVEELFDVCVDLAPRQGVRTLKTEEAVWVALSRIQDLWDEKEDEI